ncbi:protein LTV1 homolog [Phymastichus coffea]|uniref:protein LTV1 homolog n=1 Tax=Phymastichus coffea TaxID=108790 RepID=UPI00273B4202|nr:protein LTV1 homolog [Phymastichus coffea]
MSKKFNKKNAVTFSLVHRSQHDPLVADESAPQRVLVPLTKQNKKQTSSTEIQKEAIHKYRVCFDHDYEYLKNLTDVRRLDNEEEAHSSDITSELTDTKITLPSSVFQSNVEEKVGLLNKAIASTGLNLNLDSDVVAALDDDFDFDDPNNQLEDNFMELANQQLPFDECDEEYNEEFDDNFDEDFDGETYYGDNVQFESLDCPFANEETKSRFTEYSISSSVMKRNDQLTILDDKFEKLYADYDEHIVGSLDCEEIEGNIEIDSERLLQISNQYNEENEVVNVAELMKDKMNLQTELQNSSDVDSDNEPINAVTIHCDKNKWDCESILGLYNNKNNLPQTISERKDHQTIKINTKTGIPTNSEQCLRNIRAVNLPPELRSTIQKSMNSQRTCTLNKSVYSRPKNESPEERRQRKQLVKDERKERRKERKINLLAFKEEEKKQKKILLNKNQNIQGNRIL